MSRSPRRFQLLCGSVITSAMLAGAGQAAAAAAEATSLGELTVTAQKREENLQDVPISVQALTTRRLEELHVSDFNDYIKFLPSVAYQSLGPGTSNVYMRGVASDNFSNHSGSQPSVGTYLDEQPITTISGALDIHIYDIARVEALAGPQGTLYGASSMAGTIRIITNKPETGAFHAAYDLEVNRVAHGDTGYSGEGFVNIPLADNVAVRLVGWAEHEAGYIDNVHGTRTWSTPIPDSDNAAFVKDDFNTVNRYGGRAALKIDLDDNWTILPAIMAQDTRSKGVSGFDTTVGDLQVQHFSPDTNHDRWYQASLTVEGKISDLQLTYSGGHMLRVVDSQNDYMDYSYFYDQCCQYAGSAEDDNGDFIEPLQRIIGYDRFTKDSHELRIASPADNRFRFIAGLFYQRQTHLIVQDYKITDFATSLSPTGWPGTIWLTDEMRIDRDYAGFGEVNFDLTDRLTLTGGIRFYKYDNTLEGFYGFGGGFSGSTGEVKCFAPATVYHGPCTNIDKRVSDTGETHKLNVTYRIAPDKMIYATYSTGFRPGGVNRNGDLGPYRQDSLDNYEVGWKTSWLDGTLRWNGALYYARWHDFQFQYLGPNSLTVIANSGDAEIYGAETDIYWRPAEGLTLRAAAALNDAKSLQDFCNDISFPCLPADISAPKGQQLPVTPKFKGNITARYEFDVGGAQAHLQGSVIHQSSSWSDYLTVDRETLGLQQPYTVVDLSAGIAKDSWTVELALLNAFDERAQLYRYAECTIDVCGNAPYIVPNRPRTISLRFGQRF